MKRQIFAKLLETPRLNKRDWLWAAVPFLLWAGSVHMREHVIDTHCAKTPQFCQAEHVIPIDRVSLGQESGPADGFSYFTQNFSGALALGGAVAWNLTLGAPGLATRLTIDIVILLQTMGWNGLFTELSHLTSSRPRPFVYQNPAERGRDPAHYTSFYSGHTSYVAASLFGLFFVLMRRGAPAWLLLLTAASGQTLIFMTGIYRVFAGRHFITDVVVASIAGALVATFVPLLRKGSG